MEEYNIKLRGKATGDIILNHKYGIEDYKHSSTSISSDSLDDRFLCNNIVHICPDIHRTCSNNVFFTKVGENINEEKETINPFRNSPKMLSQETENTLSSENIHSINLESINLNTPNVSKSNSYMNNVSKYSRNIPIELKTEDILSDQNGTHSNQKLTSQSLEQYNYQQGNHFCTCNEEICTCSEIKTFYVTLGSKKMHPNRKRIPKDVKVWYINGKAGPVLKLRRGVRYRFKVNPKQEDLFEEQGFFLSKDLAGGKENLEDRLTDPLVKGYLEVEVNEKFPKYSYFQSDKHEFVGGWVIVMN